MPDDVEAWPNPNEADGMLGAPVPTVKLNAPEVGVDGALGGVFACRLPPNEKAG